MATKAFALNTEPHVADVNSTELSFLAGVMGDDFMDAHVGLHSERSASTTSRSSTRRRCGRCMRRLMLSESAELLTKLQVLHAGKVLETFTDREAAEEFAATVKGGAAPRTPCASPTACWRNSWSGSSSCTAMEAPSHVVLRSDGPGAVGRAVRALP
ncbi:hypothetical protein ACFWFI_10565 [Streptomyces sp. NPDC060209]|uniref:hypothetical protein n=1 Tax=Streptomyces sp. NPDC060209 TaxID=3347073 RepID=UPI0036487C70